MSSLYQNEVKYDNSRKEELQQFIDFLEKIAKKSRRTSLGKNDVYFQLEAYGVKKTDLTQKGYLQNIKDTHFEYWINHFFGHPKIFVENPLHWDYYCTFDSRKKPSNNTNYIKLYIPLDYEHIKTGAIQLFEYISSLDVCHISKIGEEIRSDNVIVRVAGDDYESAQKIINFINNNKYIKEGLNKVNPLLPTINSVGIMFETGKSYNMILSNLLSKYITELKENKRYDGNVDEFFEYVKKHAEQSIAEEEEKPLSKEQLEVSKNIVLETLGSAITGKQIKLQSDIIPQVKVDSGANSTTILLRAICATCDAYGFEHTVFALKKCFKGDYDSITRGKDEINYREELQKKLPPKELHQRVQTMLKIFGLSTDNIDDEELVTKFVEIFTKDKDKFATIRDFDKIFITTCQKYGKEQLSKAIKKFFTSGDALGFARYYQNDTTNQREKLIKMGRKRAFEILQESLLLKKISVECDESILDKYCDWVQHQCSIIDEMNNEKHI